ncbi:MAG: quinone-dependent dihydroorotate dehydrogenase [Cytophagales bacterium]|nr:quinone-dependent dihydroorotate dehydrogenase [Cytophagales bacterium]
MYNLLKPFFFMMSPEKAHIVALKLFKFALSFPGIGGMLKNSYAYEHPDLETEVLGLKFKNPLGLAAGFDKNAEFMHQFSSLGFGFIEIGTVTPRAQHGNLKPRLFRLPKDEALINRMGFNNKGATAAKRKLKKRPKGIIIGGNIGKNKNTPNEMALSDYLICFKEIYPYVDYLVLNVSSPNTPDLRQLQDQEPLEKLLTAIVKANKMKPLAKPILLKIAPDVTDSMLDDILEIVSRKEVDGIIATNTTIDRESLKTSKEELDKIGDGGLSGRPLASKSDYIINFIRSRNRTIPIIAVGGIMSPEDAIRKFEAGADLVQIYTGLIYKGPSLIKEINQALVEKETLKKPAY